MIRAITSFFSAPPFQHEAHDMYLAIVKQARNPVFYEKHDVADTLDGRFDMIALHLYLIIERFKKEETHDAAEFMRTLTEVFFSDMDRSLREMGSSDTGVGKRIKKMSQAFYGRLMAYQTAGNDSQKMQEAVLRNVYRGDMEKLTQASHMADYMQIQRQQLAKAEILLMLAGDVEFTN